MDLANLIDIAGGLGVPGLAERGVKIVRDAAEFANLVKVNAERAADVLSDGTRAEIDAIHAEALAAADTLEAKLVAAEQR